MNKVQNRPDVFGYWWAHEDVSPEDADWLLVFVDVKAIHYGDVIFEKDHFDFWVKSDFSDEIQELNRNAWRLVKK